MLSITSTAVAMMVQATIAHAPVTAMSCVPGRSRMKRVSVSDRRNTRRSGKCRSRRSCSRIASVGLKGLVFLSFLSARAYPEAVERARNLTASGRKAGDIPPGWRKIADQARHRSTLRCLPPGQRPVEIRRQPGLGALFLVEGRLQRAAEITAHEVVEHVPRIEIVTPAQEVEPFRTVGDVVDLLRIDHLHGLHGAGLARAPENLDHARRH